MAAPQPRMMPAIVVRIAAIAVALLLLAACTARVALPDVPRQAREVVFLDHGRHSSLVLTDGDDVPWRFAYGDWAWYVERRQGPADAARALFRPTTAALGRKGLRPADDPQALQPQVGSEIRNAVAFAAEAGRVDALLRELHAVFENAGIAPAYHERLQLEVVPHPRPYTFGHNSNHQVAAWLRALGAEVRGTPAFGHWRIAPSAPETRAGAAREDEPRARLPAAAPGAAMRTR